MAALVLLLASLASAAPAPPAAARLEAALSSSPAARRLLLAAGDAARRETHASGLAFAIDERGGSRPEIVVDLGRLEDLPAGEAEAEYARALARAAVASPIPLVEAEQASWLWTAQVLTELARVDPALSGALRAAGSAPARGAPALDRAALFLKEFERGPRFAYWLIESGSGLPRLTDIEDLFALHGAELRGLRTPPEGPYLVLSGRRYPAALGAAAYRLKAPGEPARLREALGGYDTVGAAALSEALTRWRRAAPGDAGRAR
jgi:hypothetical protein